MNEETFESRDGAIDFGKDYEYLMAAYYALTLSFNDEVVDFKMSTNNDDMGDFDDVVIETEMENGEQHVFALQLKHTERIIALITLTNEKNKKFGLKKYSEEFKKIKVACEKSNSYCAPFENFHFILFSNSVLEKFEEISEDGKKLVESDITILRHNDCIGKKLLNLCDIDNNFIYKFTTENENSNYGEFFKQFSFYTKQKSAVEVQTLIAKIILDKFKNCNPNIVINYLDFFNYWCRRDFGAFKVTKQDVRLKFAEFLLNPFIPDPNLAKVENFKYDDIQPPHFLQANINIVSTDGDSDIILNKIWHPILFEFFKFTNDWNKPIPSFYVDEIQKIMEIPISAFNANYNELSLKKICIILWHKGIFPIVLKNQNPINQNMLLGLQLSKDKENKRKFIILSENIKIQDLIDMKIIKDLSDLLSLDIILQRAGNLVSFSLQRQAKIPLEKYLLTDEYPINILSITQHFPKFYVTRLIPKILLDVDVLEKTDDLFIINADNAEELRKNLKINMIDLNNYFLLKQSGIAVDFIPKQFHVTNFGKNDIGTIPKKFVFLMDSDCTKDQFDEICSFNKNQNCHRISIIDDKRIELIESRGSVKNLQQFRLDFRKFSENDFVKDLDSLKYFTNKINIICSEPGMGKSIIMKAFNSFCPSTHWAINANLQEHMNFFKIQSGINEVLEYFIDLESRKCPFIGEVIRIFASKKKILLLWDGFDELPQSCVDSIISVIQDFANEEFLQWISARTNMKKFLETTFGVLSLTLTQFSEQNQYEYVYHHSKQKYEDQEVVKEIVNKITENITASLSCGYFDYSGVPLQIHMLTEIFLRNPEKLDEFEIVILTDIYEQFIQGKFDYLFEKAEADRDNYHMQLIQEQFKNIQLPQYEIAALKSSFDDETFSSLHLNCDELLEEIVRGEDILGLIVGINNDNRPVFAHKTYEEFLTASWLAKNWRNHRELIQKLFQSQYNNIRVMFDMLLAKNCPVHFAVIYRNLNLLEKHKAEIPFCKDNGGRNALHIASSWGRPRPLIKIMENETEKVIGDQSNETYSKRYEDILQFLLEKNINIPNLPDSESAMALQVVNNIYKRISEQSTENPEIKVSKLLINTETTEKVEEEVENHLQILSFLLDHDCNPLEKDELFNWNAFEYSDKTLCLGAINLMLNYEKIQLSSLKNYSHMPTLAHYSSFLFYDNLLENIKEIPYIEYKFEHGTSTLLQMAAEVDNLEFVSKLLKIEHYKASINFQSAFLGNNLYSAAIHGNLEMVDILLAHGANVNGHKSPPLLTAAFVGHKDICQKLLKAGANVNDIASSDGNSALFSAIVTEQLEIMKLLLDHGADVNHVNNDVSILMVAVKNDSLKTVQLLLEYGADVNWKNKTSGYTALHFVAMTDKIDLINCLADHGADARIKCNHLETPLHIALFKKQEKNAIELIAIEPSVVNEEDEYHLTPMVLAALENYPEIIELLASLGANMDGRHIDMSPLHAAAQEGFDSSVSALIRAGASVNRTDSEGRTPLFDSLDHLSVVKILLDNSADINFKNNNGMTPLHFAVRNGNLDVVKELISRGADINAKSKDNETPLTFSYDHIEIMKYLLEQGANIENNLVNNVVKANRPECLELLLELGVNEDDLNLQELSPLHFACLNGFSECVKILLDKGFNPNVFHPDTCSPLLLAIATSRLDIIKLLVQAGANIETALLGKANALCAAAAFGDTYSLIFFISMGANVNAKDDTGRTALHYLSEGAFIKYFAKNFQIIENSNIKINYNLEECAKELIEHGAVIDEKDVHFITPLHLACHNKINSLIKIFVERGSDVNALTDQNLSPLHLCYFAGDMEAADFLLENSAQLDIEDNFGKTPNWYAVQNIFKNNLFDIGILKKLDIQGADLNLSDENGFTLLHHAALQDRCDIIEFLVSKGANIIEDKIEGNTTTASLTRSPCQINIQDRKGNTALHYAAQKGYQKIVSYLIKAGAEVNTQNNNGDTPLQLSTPGGFCDCSKILIETGAPISTSNVNVLEMGINSGNPQMVELLIQKGATIDAELLQQAVSKNCLEIVKILINSGGEVNSTVQEGRTPLMLTYLNKDLEIAEFLLANGANINQKDNNGMSALYHAANAGNLDLLKLLHENGGDIRTEINTGSNLLTGAVNHLPVMDYLIQNGCDVNHKNKDGFTALHNACISNDYNGCKLLIQNGADINATTTSRNLTPAFYAAMHGSLDSFKILTSYNADICIKSVSGFAPLAIAVNANQLAIVKYITDSLKGSNCLHDDSSMKEQYQKGFYAAAYHNHVEMIKYLHENKLVEINGKDYETHLTALHCACDQGSYESALYLIKNGADVNAAEIEGITPLYFAANKGNLPLVKLLVENNGEIDKAVYHGNTSLFTAAANGFLEIVQYLHAKGAKLDVIDEDGDSPLHDAAARGHLPVVKYLVSCNVDVKYKNKNGKTPMDLAVAEKKEEIVEFFKKQNCFLSKNNC